jgi:hypothetical protein
MDNRVILGIAAVTVLVLTAVLVYIFVYKKSNTSSSVSSPVSSSVSYDDKGDLWLYDRWTSGSVSATYGSPINTNSMECDYCGCPINCDGTPRRIDPGCPPQTIQCVTQDCRVTPNCHRGTLLPTVSVLDNTVG